MRLVGHSAHQHSAKSKQIHTVLAGGLFRPWLRPLLVLHHPPVHRDPRVRLRHAARASSMGSPSQDPPYTNPYPNTLTIPTPESLPVSQYPYINQYYANMYNPNAMQAVSPYSTPYSSTTSNCDTPTPTLYDRYKDSGMMNNIGPMLLSLICPKYQDLPSNSNPLFAIRLYVKLCSVAYRINQLACGGGGNCAAPY